MEPTEHLHALRAGADAFLAAADGDLEQPVRYCPGWQVHDLVRHLGGTWGWAAAILRTGARADRPEAPPAEPTGALRAWAHERAEEVTGAVERFGVAAPDENCWTFGMPRTRRFWVRRMAQETAVHAWDAQDAAGGARPIDGEVATDGIDELLDVILPRCLKANPAGWSGETVHLHRTDGEGEWLVRLDPSEPTVEHGHAKGDVAVRGPASSLYLWCTGRGRLDELADIDAVGDTTLAGRWSSDIAF